MRSNPIEEFNILYRDDSLIAVYKPAGHLVHPADHPQDGDLVTMKILRDQIGARVYPVHRLDRPTCGVLLFALDQKTSTAMVSAFKERLVQKSYRCVTQGSPPSHPEWTCTEPIQKKEGSPPKDAQTDFRLLETLRHPALSALALEEDGDLLHLIEARPVTGRFHQIRRHLLHHGTPIVGDFRYAGEGHSHKLCRALGIGTRMLLQASTLSFPHPHTGEATKVSAPSDPAFENIGFMLKG